MEFDDNLSCVPFQSIEKLSQRQTMVGEVAQVTLLKVFVETSSGSSSIKLLHSGALLGGGVSVPGDHFQRRFIFRQGTIEHEMLLLYRI